MLKEYTITAIDHASFPHYCQPHIDTLPASVYISDDSTDVYRTDAAQGGVLAHNPYHDCNVSMADFPDAVPGGHRVETCQQACCETCPPDSRRNEDGK